MIVEKLILKNANNEEVSFWYDSEGDEMNGEYLVVAIADAGGISLSPDDIPEIITFLQKIVG